MSDQEDIREALALIGHKSISEASGESRKGLYKQILNRVPATFEKNAQERQDNQQALIELTYIRAAIAIAEGSNDIGADISIGPLNIGISLNNRLVPVLQAEAEEIEKFLRGEENNWE
jgi:hypothetical protein